MQKIKKSDFIAGVAGKVEGISKKNVEAVVNATFACMTEHLKAGDAVPVHGFGTFAPVTRKERTATNPKTKEKIPIPSQNTVSFKASKSLKDELN